MDSIIHQLEYQNQIIQNNYFYVQNLNYIIKYILFPLISSNKGSAAIHVFKITS